MRYFRFAAGFDSFEDGDSRWADVMVMKELMKGHITSDKDFQDFLERLERNTKK